MEDPLLLLKKKRQPASLLRRLLAFMIDLAILDLVVFFPFKLLIESYIPENIGFVESYRYIAANPNLISILNTISIFIGILSILYFSILEYKVGKTIGKMIIRLEVKSELKEKSYWQFLVRSLFLMIVFPFSIIFFVDLFYLLFNKTQRWTERISKTIVVEKR